MPTLTRRSFVAAAALGASAAAIGTRRASAGLLDDLLGGADDASAEEQAGGAAAAPGFDFSSLSDDQTASVLLRSLIGFDFRTVLERCAIQEYLQSGSWILAGVRQLSMDAFVDIPIDWSDFPLHIGGTLLAFMSAQLRGYYASDIMRPIARAVADAAGIDVTSMEKDAEKRAANVSRQLLELDAALNAFDATSAVEVMGVQKCTSINECVEMGWLGPSYAFFESGRECAALLDEAGSDLATSVYRCTLGYQGEPEIVVTLPLVRYASGWLLQRPVWYQSPDVPFVAYAYNSTDGSGDGAHSVSAVELPAVDYDPVAQPDETPFETVDGTVDALLAAFGYDVPGSSLAGERNVIAWNSAPGFERLFCAESYLAELDLAHAYDLEVTSFTYELGYLNFGSIGSFFSTGGYFLPVSDPRFRVLSAATYVSALGTERLLYQAHRITIRRLSETGLYDPVYLQLIDAFSPMPMQASPLTLGPSLPMVVLGRDASEEQITAFWESFEFPFPMIADYLDQLAAFWDELGQPVASYVSRDEQGVQAAASVANFMGGQPENAQVIFYKNDAMGAGHTYRGLHLYVAPCGQGWRLADIEFLSVYDYLLPSTAIMGIDSLQGVELDYGLGELLSAESEGYIEGARDLR